MRLVFRLQPARGAGTHRIAGWFGHVGDRLLDHGRELVDDRPGLVDELTAAREERHREQGHDETRWAANLAFEAGDWATVVRELEPVRGRAPAQRADQALERARGRL